MGRTGLVRSVIIFVFIMLSAAAISTGLKTSNAQVPATGSDWQQIPNISTDIDFRDVFMADVNTGIAVGKQDDRGVAYELRWTAVNVTHSSLQITPVSFSFRAPLWAAVMVGQDVWAVGEQGVIAHEKNGVWGEMASPVPDAQLLTLQMLGNGEEGWAGGFRPTAGGGKPEPVMLHYANGQWERDESITGEGSINALHFAQGGGWAVGGAGIWHYSKGQWSKEQEPNPCPERGCFPNYNAVRAITSDEAWIAGSNIGLCGICVPFPYILHRESGKWQIVLDGIAKPVQDDPTQAFGGIELYGLTFTESGQSRPAVAWAVGTARRGLELDPYILWHSSDQPASQWAYVPSPAGINSQLTSVSATDAAHAMAVGTGGAMLSFGYGPQSSTPTPTLPGGSNPAQRVSDPHNPNVTYFAEVGHTLGGAFRDYWQQHGGLEQFGYPLTEEFSEVSPTDGKSYVTQYFERARFEQHPENKQPYNVLLGLLGRTVTAGRENEEPFKRAAATLAPGTIYFDATGHNMASQFAGYWQQHGGLPVYGYPISEPFNEVSPTDGKTYLVQYFERNRLEYHPELPEAFRVSLGLLGTQVLRERGWIP